VVEGERSEPYTLATTLHTRIALVIKRLERQYFVPERRKFWRKDEEAKVHKILLLNFILHNKKILENLDVSTPLRGLHQKTAVVSRKRTYAWQS